MYYRLADRIGGAEQLVGLLYLAGKQQAPNPGGGDKPALPQRHRHHRHGDAPRPAELFEQWDIARAAPAKGEVVAAENRRGVHFADQDLVDERLTAQLAKAIIIGAVIPVQPERGDPPPSLCRREDCIPLDRVLPAEDKGEDTAVQPVGAGRLYRRLQHPAMSQMHPVKIPQCHRERSLRSLGQIQHPIPPFSAFFVLYS